MNTKLYNMLKSDIEARKCKALLTLHLMDEKSVGIGDHSTDDFYNNAKDAISELATANDELDALNQYVEEGIS
jgi:hypothetical protein